MRSAAWIILLCVTSMPLRAQVLLNGVVSGSDDGLPLPAATVQVEGQALGTVTSRDGRFTLAVATLPVTLLVRHIGYSSRRIDVVAAGPLRIQLDPSPVELGELVVSGEDPALPIMRHVLARKQAWRDSISTSYAEVYSRFQLYREFDLVEVEETIGAHWWHAGLGVRQITRARRVQPDRPEQFLYAAPTHVPNLYDDQVPIEGTRFLGPLHPDALDNYRFRLTGQRAQDGRLIHDIAYTPFGLTAAGFVGTLAVEDSTFDVLLITARPTIDRMGPPPVLDRSVRMEQHFARRGIAMVPVYFEANGAVRFGRAGVRYPRARYRQVSGLSLHVTGVQLPDTLRTSGRSLRDDPGIQGGTWLFSWNPGMIPLTDEERREMDGMRSNRGLGAYFRPEGLLAQYAAIPIAERREEPPEIGVPDPVWFKPWVWFNRVDGWHIGLRPEVPLTRSVTLRPGLAFAEAPDEVRWTAAAHYDEGPWSGSFGAERLTGIVGVGKHPDRFLTGLAAYAGWDDYFDYYDRARRWATLGFSRRISWEVTASHEEHRSVPKQDDYEGWLKRNVQRANPPIDEGTLAALSARLGLGEPDRDARRLTGHLDLQGEVASEGMLGSDFGFSRWQGAASLQVPTLMRRRAVPAMLRLDVVAGGGSAGVPVQRRGVLDVATGPVAGEVAFRSRHDARLVARRWAALFWQHDFGSAIAERMGFGETNLGIVVFGAHGTAWHGSTTRRDEIGIAWSKPFNLPFRINLATDLREWSPLVTLEYYGVARRLLGR
ncbi:MAG: carboxypeptidase-like regulatory domain-containing protein [Rhodothermales bacterium]|nr:carboxypeptidase-like regulatory domain-containing protein [Rhodothermales bacterium]MBO6779443.1 carboxypeptidase-like regulatory domain-containing protein [Rhodothermales bacterium]